ncbi:GNAT family N-acetyltransferase [Saccharospirillum salsuginis]|uniref:N-acetyltransferase domain-containing protein n=1 Tax=Saccharospirillum salsuginis TaxID=418750 RepID=A0A918KGX1_9GAMM|nr:GNAT family N-acetyltransferase [Saccharospirillum salsuginis]GGX63315.1 hypothetical protein GCM10007392_34010 [Saccharospirillum salsuginis]
MTTFRFETLDVSDEKAVVDVARIHHDCPTEWDPHHRYTQEDLDKTIAMIQDHKHGRNHVLLVRNSDLDIVGMHWARVGVEPTRQPAYLMSLWVRPGCRRQGVATELKRQMEDWLLALGVGEIRTHVHAQNQTMLDFNKRLGFGVTMIGMSKKVEG